MSQFGLADLCIVAMDNGPIGVVEYIGQGFADTGEVAILIVVKFAGKMLKTNVSPKKAEVKAAESCSNTPKGLIGHDFEEYLTQNIGGDGSFSVGGRDFDGGIYGKRGNFRDKL